MLAIVGAMPHTTADDGTQLFYKDLGAGPVVLMLHSWALHAGMWEYQLHPLLDAGYRLVLPDRRGHGRSDHTATGFDLDTLARDLEIVLDTAGVDDCAVVAHSTGGMEAVRLAGRRPGVRALALVAPIGPDMDGALGRPPLDAALAALRADRPQSFRVQTDAYFARPGSGVSDALVEDAMADILRTPLEVATALLDAAWRTDLTAETAALDVPVLVVHGDADASAPLELTGRRYADLAPQARLSLHPGAPHGIYATHAAALGGELVGFLAEHHRPALAAGR